MARDGEMKRGELDLPFVRSQFPAFTEPTLRDQVFFENAGGSYACGAVIDRLSEYYRRLKVQPYYGFPASAEAGAWMDQAHARLAEYLGVGSDEIHFGPSTSQNSYVLAQAFRKLPTPASGAGSPSTGSWSANGVSIRTAACWTRRSSMRCSATARACSP
jgi:selenocysteine lyase/cysteine desulfurase